MKNQIILQMVGRANEQVIINNNGIFQKNVSDVSTQKNNKQKKKVYDYNNLSFKLSQVKSIPEIKDFNFVVSMSQIKKISVLKCEVKGKDELQRLFRFIGKFVFIKGLEGIIEDSYKIGQGSFSKIYLINTIYGERFALKTFDKKTTNGKTYKTFLNQLKIMRTLSNPYLLSSEYVFQTQKYYYIKLQYLKNTLKTIIRKKMTIKQQKSTMRQLLEGLVQMSRHNIIHRDLKPENIMIRELPNDQWQCVIIDFGLGVIASQRPYLYSRCGTPGFISPEIANLVNKQQTQSVRSDIFSLGCIFYNILIGQYLFNGKNANDILLNNRKLNYSTYHFNKMSLNERDLLEKMLAKDPSTRIKPQQALKHPYLISEIDDQDQIPDQQNMLSIKMKKLNKMFIIKNMETIISTSITMHENSLNQNSCNSSYSHVKYSKIKDSCATFDLQIKASSHADNHDDFIIGLSFQEDSNNQKERSHSKGKKTQKQSNFKPKKKKNVDKQQTQ